MGGSSRRMGVDKAALIVDGAPLADRSFRALADAGCSPVMAVGGEESAGTVLASPYGDWRPDVRPGEGPAAAIADLLATSAGPLVVLPCDLPAVTVVAVTALIRAAVTDPSADAVVATIDGRFQYPIGVWRRVNRVNGAASFAALTADRRIVGVDLGPEARDADCPLDLPGADIVTERRNRDS